MPRPGETFLRALDELTKAQKASDQLGVRQASEKAWLAVVQATDRFLQHEHGLYVTADERAHRERRGYLRTLNRGDLESTYVLLSQRLHGDIFYLGEPVTSADLREFFQDAADFEEMTTGEGGLVDAVLSSLT